MTVSSTIISRKEYSGNDVTTTFPITFPYATETSVTVVLVSITGAETAWTQDGGGDTGYTIAAGSVEANTAPATGTTLVLYRDTDQTQETDLKPNRAYSAEILEAALDKLTLLVQELHEEITRAMRVQITQALGVDLELPTPVADMIIGWNSDATALENKFTSTGINVLIEVTKSETGTLTAAECSGTLMSNYGQTEENTQTLPTASEGLNAIVVIGTSGAGAFHLKAGPSDKIYLDGTALDDGDKVSIATPAVGDHFTFISFQTGSSTLDWIVESGRGSLIDGGA